MQRVSDQKGLFFASRSKLLRSLVFEANALPFFPLLLAQISLVVALKTLGECRTLRRILYNQVQRLEPVVGRDQQVLVYLQGSGTLYTIAVVIRIVEHVYLAKIFHSKALHRRVLPQTRLAF